MMTEQQMRMMMEMFNNPMFKQGASEFLKIAQQQGMEAAKKFWGISSENQAFPDAEKMIERMADFYQTLGFVPQTKYDDLLKENASLKAENQMLSDTIRELQQKFIAENGAKAQKAWQEIVDKQLDMSREVTKSFFDVLKQSSPTQGE
jgi:regulator of replication initiation timing